MQTLVGNTAPAPQQTPDYNGIEYAAGGAVVSMNVDIWWETEELGTAIVITRGSDRDALYDGLPSVAARWVSNFVEFGQTGLDPVLQDLGLAVSTSESTDPGYTHYAFATLPTKDLIERANSRPYPAHLGRRMQFEPYNGDIYSIEEFFTAMAEGRMLIPVTGDDPWIKFHDVGDHMISGLAMSSELVEAMMKRSRHILDNPQLLAQIRDSATVGESFLSTWDRGTFSRHFLGFLNEEPEDLETWSKMLDTDIETVRGYAVRAREELRQIGMSGSETAAQAPRAVKRRGWLGRLLFS